MPDSFQGVCVRLWQGRLQPASIEGVGMKWDGQTNAIVGSVVVAITTITGTAFALGATIQTGHADIRSDVREIRTQMGAMDNRLDGIDRRLTRMQVHLFGSEPETLARP